MKCSTSYRLALGVWVSLIATLAVSTTTAFVSISSKSPQQATTTRGETAMFVASGETEVEKLLRMARELRAQAEESEKKVHDKRVDVRADKETRFGSLMNLLFYDGTKGKDVGTPDTAINQKSVVVTKLRSKNPSIETLEKFVDWMDDRRDTALGYEHVGEKSDGTYAKVRGKKDEAEADRLFRLTEGLLDALEVIDEQPERDNGHLGGGHNASDLRQRLREKRRERDSQFLERQQSFVDAQTIKEGKSKYEFHDEFLDDRD